MPDLHSWISQQIDKVEAAAREATSGPWFADHPEQQRWGDNPEARLVGGGKTLGILSNDYNGHVNAEHIALHGPATVLRRCTADRKALALHRPESGQHPDFCGYDKHELPCPGLRLLAEAYGWEEQADA